MLIVSWNIRLIISPKKYKKRNNFNFFYNFQEKRVSPFFLFPLPLSFFPVPPVPILGKS